MLGNTADVTLGEKNAIVISGDMTGKNWKQYVEYMKDLEREEGIKSKPGKADLVAHGYIRFVFSNEDEAKKAIVFVALKKSGSSKSSGFN
ncbi:MAG: hypothetical protein WC933_01265 [Candidatus Paceibacterota bacterium]|jgi:hypothetical protein